MHAMKDLPRTVSVGLTLTLLLGVVASFALTAAPASAADPNPGILPPQSHPFGRTYGEWAAAWHSWRLSVPVSVNPALDSTGANCGQGQSGNVWFLHGIPADDEGPGTRSCTVPAGKGVFLPVQNTFYYSWPTDPQEWSPEDEAYYRGEIAGALEDHGLAASVDGDPVNDLLQYAVTSPVFRSWVPDDNLIDYWTELWLGPGLSDWAEGDLSGPHVDAGVYLMLAPLSTGAHEISISGWDGEWAGTWYLTVQ